jgi:WD40 repeat protein
MIGSGQEGNNPMIRIWDYETGKCLVMFTVDVASLKCITFSPDGSHLAISGKDYTNREMIVVWNISQVQQGGGPIIVAKQVSDFNILTLKFSPFDNMKIASCGKENIRFWRIKNQFIQGSAVVLNQHARNTIFTDLDFENGFKSSDPVENEQMKRMIVCSKSGMVFMINYHTHKLEQFFQIHDGAIHSLSVN